MAYTRNTNKTAEGLSLLTPKFIKVNRIEECGDSFYYEIGASKWKIRTNLEGLRDLYDKIGEAIAEADEDEE